MSHKNICCSNRGTQLEIYVFKNISCFLQSSTVKRSHLLRGKSNSSASIYQYRPLWVDSHPEQLHPHTFMTYQGRHGFPAAYIVTVTHAHCMSYFIPSALKRFQIMKSNPCQTHLSNRESWCHLQRCQAGLLALLRENSIAVQQSRAICGPYV